jgi:sn-1 stearoyl-lipid 9-desaturase
MVEFLIVFVTLYIWHALGITIGYHRLLSHRSFSCPKFVEYFWVLAGYLAFEGSPIWWATMHRAHHRYVDTPLDPHSPRYGLKNAHTGWLALARYPSHISPEEQAKDLLKDPVYRFLEQGGDLHRGHAIGFLIGFVVRAVLLVLFGWKVALASLLAGLAVLQIPLMLNVFCHIPKLGYKNYAVDDDSVNVWWVAVLAMGEGWHNNHHAFPGSAQSGMRRHEFDFSWFLICLMKKFNLVQRVNVPTAAKMRQLDLAHQKAVASKQGLPSLPELSAAAETLKPMLTPQKVPAHSSRS